MYWVLVHTKTMGMDCAVSIATRYWLDGLGIKTWWRQNFPHPSILALGPTQPPIQWVLVFPGGKVARVWH
jgi:hypothetical protein